MCLQKTSAQLIFYLLFSFLYNIYKYSINIKLYQKKRKSKSKCMNDFLST